MSLEKVRTKLPCGGRIVICFYRNDAVGGNGKEVIPMPEVHCPGAYDERKGCPWLESLRKFYGTLTSLDERALNGHSFAVEDESKIVNDDGTVTHIIQAQCCGLVVRGTDVFNDLQMPLTSFEDPPERFYCCNDVKAKHGRIISFIRRLFCRGK